MNLKSLSIAGLVIAVLALVMLTFQNSILANGIVTIIIQILAVLLFIWARVTFGLRSFHAAADPTSGGLITSGPYHYIRHPIYAAVIYFVWAGIFSHLSLLNVLLGTASTFGLIIRIFAEEQLVTKRYPEYIEYATRTKYIIPFVL
jgi:protein-S-isoprenylcysteine O-methyltransferase Ste14